MEHVKTVEDVIDRLNLVLSNYDIRESIIILAKEIKELKKRETENRLLIEHEETVRTTKAKPTTGGKNTAIKFKVGDIVDYNPIGTSLWAKAKVDNVQKSTSKRNIAIVLMESISGVGNVGGTRWVTSQRLRYHLAKVS